MTKIDLPPVLVVGLGLIGGSVALGLSRKGITVRGVSRSERTVERAVELGAVQGGSTRLEDEVHRAGLVLLAAPVRATIRLLPQVGALARPGTVVTDASSSKSEVVQAMNDLPSGVGAVGGHPMAGRESSGIDAADPTVFDGATWVLTETERTHARSREVCARLARLCGAEPLWTSAREHDEAAALISHLPLLASAALVLAAESAGSELAWKLAASGFRDATRLAAGDPEMGADLLLTNLGPVGQAYTRFVEQLAALLDATRESDAQTLTSLLESAARRRRTLYGGSGTSPFQVP